MDEILKKLEDIESIKGMSDAELLSLADATRSYIIDTVSRTGGHLAANLGVVELTIALLRVFNPPADKLVWDTGHQTYAYKILTDRRDEFATLRQPGGISGFQKRSESEYDAFGAGHAGTALSAALGMAAERDRSDGKEHVVAIVGDASVCNGISLEALNNVSSATKRLIVVLNDNEMSISGNVGALSRYLGKLLANPRYNRVKTSFEGFAQKLRMGKLRPGYHRFEEALKSFFVRNVLFEEFGLRYVGPVDGHNIQALSDAFTVARDYDKPILLHVATQKGRGYPPAEKSPESWHGTSCFDVPTGDRAPSSKEGYSHVFGQALVDLAADDSRICGISAAMCAGTGMNLFAERFPERFYDVGICEEHAVVFAAGQATMGSRPFVALYSTFVQRAVDCVMHDVCLQKLPVVFCLDRAGIVGDDGPTHHGVFDISMMRAMPGLTIMQPRGKDELKSMLRFAVELNAPVVVRYPRGAAVDDTAAEAAPALELGRAEVLTPAGDNAVWFWALGDMVPVALDASEQLRSSGIDAGVVNARFVKPLDVDLLRSQLSAGARCVVTLENGSVCSGFGSAVLEAVSDSGSATQVLRVGWPEQYIEHGTPVDLMKKYGLDAQSVVDRVKRCFV